MENNDHTHLNHQNPKIFKTKNKNIKSYTILNLNHTHHRVQLMTQVQLQYGI